MKKDGFFSTLTKIKGIGYIALALVAGIGLLLFSGGGEEETEGADPTARFIRSAEKSIAAMGKEVCGEDCTAMVYASVGYCYSYAGDQTVRTTYNTDGTVAEKETTLTNRTVNTQKGTALVPVKETAPQIKGVAVVCPGGSKGSLLTLKRLIMALYSLEESAVFVTN